MAPAPLHVCLLSERPLVLDGRILNQAYSLSGAGYRVTIVDQSVPGRPDALAALRVRLPQWVTQSCRVVWVSGPHPALHRFLHKHARPLRRRLISRVLGGMRADIYQAGTLETLRLVEPAACRAKARVVYDVRDFYTPQWVAAKLTAKQRRAIAVEQRVVRGAAAVTTVNDSLAQAVAQHYRVSPPAVVLNCKLVNAPVGPVTAVRSALRLDPATALLVHTGTTAQGRGQAGTMKALADLPGVHVAFVGFDDQTGALASLAAAAGVRERVSFHLPVPACEVPAYIRSADAAIAFIEPTTTNNSNALPNKVFEAVAAQLPLVASDIPEMHRLVERHRLGVLFDPGDPADLARAIREVLAHRESFHRQAVAASHELCWEREGEKYLAVYRGLARA